MFCFWSCKEFFSPMSLLGSYYWCPFHEFLKIMQGLEGSCRKSCSASMRDWEKFSTWSREGQGRHLVISWVRCLLNTWSLHSIAMLNHQTLLKLCSRQVSWLDPILRNIYVELYFCIELVRLKVWCTIIIAWRYMIYFFNVVGIRLCN